MAKVKPLYFFMKIKPKQEWTFRDYCDEKGIGVTIISTREDIDLYVNHRDVEVLNDLIRVTHENEWGRFIR